MTLLIGTVARNHIVLTADGLSRANPITGAGMECENLQKIFPHGTAPLAMVHHGLNIINQKTAGQWVTDCYDSLGSELECLALDQFTDRFIEFLDHHAHVTLQDPSNRGVIGFWIADCRQRWPTLLEICWPDNTKPTRHRPILLGGDGSRFLFGKHGSLLDYCRPPQKLDRSLVASAVAYHDKLYAVAEQLQKDSGETVFGGQKHQLVIKRCGCQWITSPR
jgi:hypothetical protein